VAALRLSWGVFEDGARLLSRDGALWGRTRLFYRKVCAVLLAGKEISVYWI